MSKIIFISLVLTVLISCGQQDGNSPNFSSSSSPSGKIVFISEPDNGCRGAWPGVNTLCQNDINKPNNGSTYEALVIDGNNKRACSSANCTIGGATENVNWVLSANTRYIRPDGTLIGTTNSAGIFTSFENPISPSVSQVWTGLNSDWTSSGNQCGGWNACLGGDIGNTGDPSSTNPTTVISNGGNFCNQYVRYICVEQ
jgi:hypothetical protein